MKLLAKLNLLLIAVFSLGLLLVGVGANRSLQRQAQAQVLHEAGLVSASASAVRQYTEEEVSPLLQKATEHETTFTQQVIPFYAATTTFQKIRKTYPDYTYKEAALNPTNLRDRASDWEADIINHFRDSPADTELIRTREGAAGTSLLMAHPIKVEAGCLQCHSQPSVAPRPLIVSYGSEHGFGWKDGEIVGAQIIAVPISVAEEKARRGLTELLIVVAITFFVALCLIDLGLFYIVIKPLRTIAENANRISQGEMELEQLNPKGKDEVAEVSRSLNRMHTSLQKAMDLLNG